jgi:hypothetical protein
MYQPKRADEKINMSLFTDETSSWRVHEWAKGSSYDYVLRAKLAQNTYKLVLILLTTLGYG